MECQPAQGFSIIFPLISLDLMDVLVDANLVVSIGKPAPQK
jgi:hypothetical protein